MESVVEGGVGLEGVVDDGMGSGISEGGGRWFAQAGRDAEL